jgi:hypothetical protein
MSNASSFNRPARFHWISALIITTLAWAPVPAFAGRPDIFDLQTHLKQMDADARGRRMQALSPAKSAAPMQRPPNDQRARPDR